jgi:hypothetical protein
VVSRCRDDFWLWAAIFVAARNDDGRSACSCRCDHEWREPSSEELAARAKRDRVDAAARRRRYLAALCYILGLIALVALVINAPSTHNRVSTQPALPTSRSVGADLEPHAGSPPPDVADVEPAAELNTVSAPLKAEPSPLPARSVIDQTAALSAAAPEQTSAALDISVFEIGS